MSQGFRLRFDQMREGDPTAAAGGEPESFPTSGQARNLCLVWPDGRWAFFNYAYLVAGEFKPDGEMNEIRLNFSAHTVTLLGYGLSALFTALLEHLPRFVVAVDERYRSMEESQSAVVVEMRVEPAAG